jgi:hypothetical protein
MSAQLSHYSVFDIHAGNFAWNVTENLRDNLTPQQQLRFIIGNPFANGLRLSREELDELIEVINGLSITELHEVHVIRKALLAIAETARFCHSV